MLFLLKSYLKFLWHSKNEHGVQSPFVFNLVTKCFYDKKNYDKVKLKILTDEEKKKKNDEYQKAYQKTYRAKPKTEEQKAAQKAYYQAHKEHLREVHKKWKEANKEKIAEYHKKHYQQNYVCKNSFNII